jgi:hypothetical protein
LKLSGRSVARNGFVRCPFHQGGEEGTPSLKLYDTTWACFGCPSIGGRRLGGSIYTFAALLWGFRLPLRGADFQAVAETLREFFMRDAEAA